MEFQTGRTLRGRSILACSLSTSRQCVCGEPIPATTGRAAVGVQTTILQCINNRLLTGVGELAPASRPQPADPWPISPEEPRVGFVFKVQANIDPQHRDRIAFVQVASGRFQRAMKLKNIRTGRLMPVQNYCRQRRSGTAQVRLYRRLSAGSPIIHACQDC